MLMETIVIKEELVPCTQHVFIPEMVLSSCCKVLYVKNSRGDIRLRCVRCGLTVWELSMTARHSIQITSARTEGEIQI